MKILCVLPFVPLPADTGGALRTLHLVQALDREFDVTVLAPHRPHREVQEFSDSLDGRLFLAHPSDLAGELRAVASGKPAGYARYASRAMAEAMARLLREETFDVIHFDHLHTAQLLPLARQLAPDALLVMDAHNVESLLVARVAEFSKFPRRPLVRWHAHRVARLERSICRQADLVLACSALDGKILEGLGAPRVKVVPNGVVFELVRPEQDTPRRDVVFIGSLDWWPNSDAALVLARDIWPRVSARLPESRLVLVGRNPPPSVRALAGGSVTVTGTVRSVGPYLAGAWATAIPLRAGSGTRLKILEAAAAGVPVVASRIAAEGLPFVDGRHMLAAETPDDFARALLRLQDDPALAARLAASAALVAQEFDWSRVGTALAAHYRALRPAVLTREGRALASAGA